MHQFYIAFHSLQDVQDFVSLASGQKHRLIVGDDYYHVNATSFMGLITLDCRSRQRVSVHCSHEEFQDLLGIFQRFLTA